MVNPWEGAYKFSLMLSFYSLNVQGQASPSWMDAPAMRNTDLPLSYHGLFERFGKIDGWYSSQMVGFPHEKSWIRLWLPTYQEILEVQSFQCENEHKAMPLLVPHASCRNNYCRPRKLQDGNVFSRVCLFTGGSHVTITHCIGPHCTGAFHPPIPQPCPHPFKTWDLTVHTPANDIWWPSLETCSSLFTSELPPSTSADTWWLLRHVRSTQADGTHPTGMLSCVKT